MCQPLFTPGGLPQYPSDADHDMRWYLKLTTRCDVIWCWPREMRWYLMLTVRFEVILFWLWDAMLSCSVWSDAILYWRCEATLSCADCDINIIIWLYPWSTCNDNYIFHINLLTLILPGKKTYTSTSSGVRTDPNNLNVCH